MKTKETKTHFIFEMTLERLAAMHSNGLSLYVTPTTDGKTLTNPYWASTPNFVDDYAILEPTDFVEIKHGYNSSAFDHEQVEACGDEVFEIKYPKIILEATKGEVKDYSEAWVVIDGESHAAYFRSEGESLIEMMQAGYIPTTLDACDLDLPNCDYDGNTVFVMA